MNTSNETVIKVMLVDDHEIIRDGIAALLREANDIEVIGQASSAEEAVNTASSIQPDIILMDIMMSGMTGIEATRWIKEQDASIKIILLSMEVSKQYISAGIQAGVSGYLPKKVNADTLIAAIRTVSDGGRWFDETIMSMVFEDYYQKEKKVQPKHQEIPGGLSKREIEVLELIAGGKSNREISEALFISVKTVETHKSNILSKLGLKNTVELVHYAIKNNLIS